MLALLRRCAFFFLFTGFVLSPLRAGTWVLVNGDRLTGTLVGESDETVEIEHPQLGRLTIERANLQGAVIERAEEVTIAASDVVPDSSVIVVTAEEPAPAPAVTAVAPAAATVQWIRRLELGYSRQDGARSREELSARAEIEARAGSNSYRGTARIMRAESQGVLTQDRHEADFRWRRDFNKRLFAQALTTYASDDIRQIDLSLEQQVGGGYRVVDGERQKMNVGLGAVVQRLAREGYEDYTALLGSAFQDYAFAWNDRFRIAQEATLFVADEASMATRGGRSAVPGAPADGNYRVKFNTTLQSRMTSHVSLNLRYEYDYDRSIPDPELRADSRLTTSLGYSW